MYVHFDYNVCIYAQISIRYMFKGVLLKAYPLSEYLRKSSVKLSTYVERRLVAVRATYRDTFVMFDQHGMEEAL